MSVGNDAERTDAAPGGHAFNDAIHLADVAKLHTSDQETTGAGGHTANNLNKRGCGMGLHTPLHQIDLRHIRRETRLTVRIQRQPTCGVKLVRREAASGDQQNGLNDLHSLSLCRREMAQERLEDKQRKQELAKEKVSA